MNLEEQVINCQIPKEAWNITRESDIVKCTIETHTDEFQNIVQKARRLAELVNEAAANNATVARIGKRKTQDAMMGVLAEEGWLQYINKKFGPIASYTEFDDPTEQIDIRLQNGELIEIRSSYIRNGVRFGICNIKHNFKNIGPYSNSIKPGEVQKHFYLAVLFGVEKDRLLVDDTITFYLIGGSTWNMMVEHGYDDPLEPKDAIVPVKSNYKVIRFKDALDVQQVIQEIENLGYPRV